MSSYFQGGECVELLNAQGKSPAATWKLQGKILRSFDKAIKGNAFHLDGSAETKMQLPKTASSLGLTQRFLVLQVLVPFTRSFSLEIGFADMQKIRRRFVVASAFRETTCTALHVQLPLGSGVPRDAWLNLVFDLHALTEQSFPAAAFRSMESLCISGSCRLKRVFTMKDAPLCPALQGRVAGSRVMRPGAFTEWREIPRAFQFAVGNSLLPIPTEYFQGGEDDATVSVPTDSESGGKAVKKPPVKAVERHRAATAVAKTGGKPVRHQERVQSAPRQNQLSGSPPPVATARGGRQKQLSPQQQSRPTTQQQKQQQRMASPVIVSPPRTRASPQQTRYRDEQPQLPAMEDEDDEDMGSTAWSGPGSDDGGDDLEASTEAIQVSESIAVSDINQPASTSTSSSSRKQQREHVMAEIQLKLDQLKQEADEEDARDRALFLKHARLVTSSNSDPAPVAVAEVECEHSSQWPDKELLRSPEPMLLRRVQPTKKPAISFSSSIFSFHHSEAPPAPYDCGTNLLPSETKRLFDWDSLLDESVGALTAMPMARTVPVSDEPVRSSTSDKPVALPLPPVSVDSPTGSSRAMSDRPVTTQRLAQSAASSLANSQSIVRPSDEDMAMEASFDFSLSPISKPVKSQGNMGLHGNDDKEEDEQNDDDDALSLDLTDELSSSPAKHTLETEERDDRTAAPESADDEDSFDFDELVVHDRHSQPQAATRVSPPRRTVRTPPERPARVRATSPLKRTVLSSTSSSSRIRHSPSTSKRTTTVTSESMDHPARRASSSTDRRLASLLESTDWSQLPLSSMVGAPASPAASSPSIELLYDPILRCYYDPIAHKYYALSK